MKNPKKILIIIQRSNGDVLLSETLINALYEYYDSPEIDLLVNDDTFHVAELLSNVSYIHQFSYQNKQNNRWLQEKRLISSIFRKYDLSINLTASDRSVLYAIIASSQSISAIENNNNKSWWKKIFLYKFYYFDNRRHILINNLESLQLLKIKHKRIQKSPKVSNSILLKMKKKLESKGINEFFIFHPSGQYSYKIYPRHLRDELLRYLSKLDIPILITGSNSEIDSNIKKELPVLPNIFDLIGVTSLEEVFALNKLALAYIGMDTFNMHIAASQNKRIFTICGPTNLSMWSPWSNNLQRGAKKNMPIQTYDNITIFQANLPCVACGKAGCDGLGYSECLSHIDPKIIIEKIKSWYLNLDEKTDALNLHNLNEAEANKVSSVLVTSNKLNENKNTSFKLVYHLPFKFEIPNYTKEFLENSSLLKLRIKFFRRFLYILSKKQKSLEMFNILPIHKTILWINIAAPSLGDTLMDLSSRVLLSGRKVDLFTDKKNADLYKSDSIFSSIYIDRKEVKKRSYDLVIMDSYSTRSFSVKANVAPLTKFIGMFGFYNGPEVNRVLFSFHRMNKILGYIKNEEEIKKLAKSSLNISIHDKKIINKLRLPETYITIALGGEWDYRTYKKWIIVIEKLIGDDAKLNIVLLGSTNAKYFALEIMDKFNNFNLTDCVDRFTFNQTAEIIKLSKFLLCCDGGLMHAANAVNTPIVSLFARLSPEMQLTDSISNFSVYDKENVNNILVEDVFEQYQAATNYVHRNHLGE